MTRSSHVGERQKGRGPFPASGFVIENLVPSLSALVELLQFVNQFDKSPLGAALATYRISIPTKMRISNSALERWLDILTGVKGPHAVVVHEQLGDIVGVHKIVPSSRTNAESVLGVRFVQKPNEMDRNEAGIRSQFLSDT